MININKQTDGSIVFATVFARWHQCAHRGGHIGATWWIRLNLCFLQHTRVHSPNGKSISSAISAQLTAKVPILYNGGPFSAKLLLVGGSGPLSISWFLVADRPHNTNCITIGSAIFTQVTTVCPYTLQWAPLSPKIAPSHGGSGPHVRHDSLDPSEPTDQTASRSVQPF